MTVPWDRCFAISWQRNGGQEQTASFMQMILAGLTDYLSQADGPPLHTIIDTGCALGDGARLLAQAFPSADVTGIDVAPTAIQKATEIGGASFCCIGLMDPLPFSADLVTCSNVLEHCHDYLEVLERYMAGCTQLFVILVPLDEQFPLVGDHFYALDRTSFPTQLNGFHRVYDAEYPGGRYWGGQQLLLIYRRAVCSSSSPL